MTRAMQTKPEQWAVELWHAAHDSFENCATQSFGDDDKAAALAIQRAFEERERKLREAAEGVMPVLDGMPMFGTEATARTEALRQALKARENGDG